MIITRTPYRISMMGGGSDYSKFYSQHGGACLTATIDRYCHVLLRPMPPFLGSRYRICYAKMENVDRVEDIEHAGVRGCLQYLGIDDEIEINHAGDMPARSGLGSSSAFAVGMLHALRVLYGGPLGAANLAKAAIAVEQDVLKETVGIQDQIECAWGGMNLIHIDKGGGYAVEPIATDQIGLADHLVLVFTGLQRYASEIAQVQVDNIERKEAELLAIMEMVKPAREALQKNDFHDFGALLHEAWMLKRSLTDKISSPEIDAIYETARGAGAWGGKVLGAGGGGFFLFCVPPERRQAMLDKLGLLSVPVKFEHAGSQLVLNA